MKRKSATGRSYTSGNSTGNQFIIIKRIILIHILAWVTPVYAQEKENYIIQRLNGPVTIDGRVDEPAWTKITPLPMVTHIPVFGNKVEAGTEIRIAYDDDFLYVSGIFDIDPEKITAPTYKRDALGWHIDALAIVLDTFRDNENALWLWVSPIPAGFYHYSAATIMYQTPLGRSLKTETA